MPDGPDLLHPGKRPHTLCLDTFPTGSSHHAMENPVDRTIRLMAVAAGVVGLLVIVAFQFI
jgi:hypothetical protein